MVESMIERVTSVIYDMTADEYPPEAIARAAIEAMREPDVEMIAAFWRQKNCGTQEVGQVGDARSDYDAWRAAIDAALLEQQP